MTQLKFSSHTAQSARGRFLLDSSRTFQWFETVREHAVEFVVLDDETQLFDTLAANPFDIVFVDASAVKVDVRWLVTELKNRFRAMAVVVIVDNIDSEVYAQAFASGADDVLEENVSAEVFMPRLEILLRQQSHRREEERRNQALHAVSVLAQLFYTADQPMALIADSITAICENLGAYGVSIIIQDGDTLHQYSGSQQGDTPGQLAESEAPIHKYDPQAQVIFTGASMIYRDVTKHPYFTPIPGIKHPKSAMIIPLKFGNQVMGSIAFFSDEDNYTSSDLAPFELLATHFASAYTNVRRHSMREADFQSARQMLTVWQALSGLYTVEEVARTLYELLAEVKDGGHAAVWLFKMQDETQEIVVRAEDAGVTALVKRMFEVGDLDQLMALFDVAMHPITIQQEEGSPPGVADLLRLLNTTDVLLVPVAGSILMGGIFINTGSNRELLPSEVNQLQSLAHAAAQAMERNTIIGSLQEQHGRLNAVLRTINEGIFFVNNFDRVVFCNPQFTELTGINPSQVIGKPYGQLLRMLARNAADEEDILGQLNNAVDQVARGLEAAEDYPIVEFHKATMDQVLSIEFSQIDGDEEQKRFIGFIQIRDRQEQVEPARTDANIVEGVMEDLLLQMTSLNNTYQLLQDRYNVLSAHRYSEMVRRVEQQVGDALPAAEMHTELVDAVKFVTGFVASRPKNGNQHKLIVNSEPARVSVMVDEHQMRQALIHVVDFLTKGKDTDDPILVNVVNEQQNVLLMFQEKTLALSEETLAHLFDPFWEPDNIDASSLRLQMYISKRIVETHGGTMHVEQRKGWGLMVRIQLPVANADEASPAEAVSSVKTGSVAAQGLVIVVVESEDRLLKGEYDALATNGHEVLVERSISDALVDLSLAHVDVVVVEVSDPHADVVRTCQMIRQKTEIPIFIAAVPALESLCVRALSNGADGYLLTPIKRDHLMAQLGSIAKRREIVSRTAEPIQIGDLHIDFSRRRVYLGNVLLDLRIKEYELLRMLVNHQNQVLTHQQLLSKIWGPEYRDQKQYLWVNVSRLRRKLEPTKDSPRYIYTQQGVGYVFREP